MKRTCRRRTFDQIRAEERKTVAAFIEARADAMVGRAEAATVLRAVASDVRARLFGGGGPWVSGSRSNRHRRIGPPYGQRSTRGFALMCARQAKTWNDGWRASAPAPPGHLGGARRKAVRHGLERCRAGGQRSFPGRVGCQLHAPSHPARRSMPQGGERMTRLMTVQQVKQILGHRRQQQLQLRRSLPARVSSGFHPTRFATPAAPGWRKRAFRCGRSGVGRGIRVSRRRGYIRTIAATFRRACGWALDRPAMRKSDMRRRGEKRRGLSLWIWCTRLDSNQWPLPSEGSALSS